METLEMQELCYGKDNEVFVECGVTSNTVEMVKQNEFLVTIRRVIQKRRNE